MQPNKILVAIHTDYVALGQFLKLANIISSGGEAKAYLAVHEILVDGVVDNRRGRKLYPGMVVEVEKHVYEIVRP